jgi:hypothetical protein
MGVYRKMCNNKTHLSTMPPFHYRTCAVLALVALMNSVLP